MKKISINTVKELNRNSPFYFFEDELVKTFNAVFPTSAYMTVDGNKIFFYSKDYASSKKTAHYRLWFMQVNDNALIFSASDHKFMNLKVVNAIIKELASKTYYNNLDAYCGEVKNAVDDIYNTMI